MTICGRLRNLLAHHETTVQKPMSEKPKNDILSTVRSAGVALAMIISWGINKSILWAVIHGFFGWAYVIYYALGYVRE